MNPQDEPVEIDSGAAYVRPPVDPPRGYFGRLRAYVSSLPRATLLKFALMASPLGVSFLSLLTFLFLFLFFFLSSQGLFVVLLLAGVFVAIKLGAALAFLQWVQGLKVWGPVVMAAAFIIGSLPIPFIFGLLTVSSGFLFKVPMGLLVTMTGGGVGAIMVFLFSRYVFRERVERYIETNAFFLRFNGRIEKEGWKLALVMRLASVPYGLVNVFLSVTKLNFPLFVLTTLAGEIPIAFIGCFIGSTLGSLSEAAGTGDHAPAPWPPTRIALFVVEMLFAITFFVMAIIVSKRMVQESLDEEAAAKNAPKNSNDSSDDDDIEAKGSYELEPIEIMSSSAAEPTDSGTVVTPLLSHGADERSSADDNVRLRRSRSNSPRRAQTPSDFGAL